MSKTNNVEDQNTALEANGVGKAPIISESEQKPETKMKKNEPAVASNIATSNKKRLRKKDKGSRMMDRKIWLAGHGATVVFGVLYGIYYVRGHVHASWVGFFVYKLALLGVMASHFISISSQFNIKSLPNYTILIGTETVQYFVLSFVWFVNRSSLFKLLPYMIVSALQLASTFKVSAVLKYEDALAKAVMYNELFLFVILLMDTILMKTTSGFGLVVYALFYWLRILQFEHVRFFLYSQLIRFDGLISKIKNKNVQSAWSTVKHFLTLRQARFENKYL